MKLSELKTGEKAVIVKVNGHGGFRKRLIEMGFITGKEVRVVLNAPLKDPIEYEILDYKVSLRREEARMIDVLSVEEARTELRAREDQKTIYPEGDDGEEILTREMGKLASERRKSIRVALVGNPNCGKTSLFNIASGSHEHVGNYSGVTVDAKEGHFTFRDYRITLVDLPGTYSLSAYSPEELYVRKNLVETTPDVIVNVVDASNMERNLYLTTQLIDMNLRMVMALNMYDELKAKGDTVDTERLGQLLGLPVCPTISRDGSGITELFDTVIKVYENSDPSLSRHIHINHGQELEKSIDRIKLLIQKDEEIRYKYSTRYLAIKYLENDRDIERVINGRPHHVELERARSEEEDRIEHMLKTNAESAIVDAKYGFIHGALAETYQHHKEDKPRRTVTDKIDAVVTNKWMAFPIFVVLLYLIFQATFSLGQFPMDWIEGLIAMFGDFVGKYMREGWVKDLVVDGVISGVGSVLVFLPNILILYFFISLMEDSGYMARAAFIVDKLMHKIGLHGKSFIPMVMGFGCNVPAIMATRTIESRKSRFITIALIPFMSCAGRLPIFVLLAGAFFPGHAPLALLGIYFLGILLAILSALVLSRFVKEDDLPFVMELPPYRIPTGKAIWRHTWEKGRQYLQKMATTILIGSIVIWGLGYLPRNAEKGPEYQQEHSYIGQIGKAVSPALEPLGFSWKMDIGLLTGVVAKELVVSTLGVMYAEAGTGAGDSGVLAGSEASAGLAASDVSEAEAPDADALSTDTTLQRTLADSVPLPAAVAYMIFILLYFPCIATFVAIKNETGRWRWASAICAYTIVIAWLAAFVGYHLTAMLI